MPEAMAATIARDELRLQGRAAEAAAEAAAAAQRDETATGLIQIFNLRTHLQRTNFLDMVNMRGILHTSLQSAAFRPCRVRTP